MRIGGKSPWNKRCGLDPGI